MDVDGRPLVVDTRKAIALLAYLAIAQRPIARDSLVELLWPEASPDGGRGALRRTLSVLRSGLGNRWLQVDRRQAVLATDGATLDVAEFRRGVADAPHRHADGEACGSCRERLHAALARYGGAFLAGFTLRDSPPFEAWQLLEAEALRGELTDGLRRLAALELAEGRAAGAMAAARRLLAEDPLDESAHRLAMRIQAAAGDRAAVARQYRECVRVLAAELGVDPSPETTSLHEELLAAPVAAARAAPTIPAPAPTIPAPAPTIPEPDLTSGARRLLEAATGLGDASGPGLEAALAAAAAHLAAGGREAEAAALDAQLGDAARRRSAHGEAAEHYRAALGRGHPDRVRVLTALGDVETLRGRYGEALVAYEAAAAEAPLPAVAAIEQRLGSLHLRRGSLDLADLHLSAALARLGTEDAALRGRLLADRSLVALRRGDVGLAARLARSALRAARRASDLEAESQAENLLAIVDRRLGDVEGGRRHLARSLARAAAAHHAPAQVAALNNLSLLERSVGNPDRALELVEEALRRSVHVGDRHREAALRNNRADLLHALGRRTEAEAEVRRSVSLFAEIGERPAAEPEIWKLVEW